MHTRSEPRGAAVQPRRHDAAACPCMHPAAHASAEVIPVIAAAVIVLAIHAAHCHPRHGLCRRAANVGVLAPLGVLIIDAADDLIIVLCVSRSGAMVCRKSRGFRCSESNQANQIVMGLV